MKIALIGNQNSGKSTLFNTLTGSNQKIGNWPGVTVEKKSGIIKGTNYELIDLPGTYSLNSYTKEEAVTSKFIDDEKIDVIINIIDCNSIARGLYLTMQLLELNKNVIIALNMHELAEKKGIKIDAKELSKSLGNVKVIKISAIKSKENNELISAIKEMTNRNLQVKDVLLNKKIDEENIKEKYKKIDLILRNMQISLKQETITDKIDKIFLNKFLTFPIFVAIMFGIYYFSIDIVGGQSVNVINTGFSQLSKKLEFFLINLGASQILVSLLIDGILTGVSSVLSFLPQLMGLFVSISVLEKIGYMSRISLIFDKLFRKIGLSGNSIISFIIGTGCSVPRNNGDENN